MTRRELREHIFKLLFISEFYASAEISSQMQAYFENIEELSDEDRAYMEDKSLKVIERIGTIDALLNEASRNWKTSRMSRVDLSTLRLAVYEILYDDAVPVGVAINEAVDIAKKYGGETSGSFINGILGRIAKDAENEKEDHG